MLRTADLLKVLITLSSFVACAVQAQGRAQAEEQEAQRWLRKMHLAAHALNYSGTFVYQQGDQVRASRLTHLVEGKNEIEKLEVLDGDRREYVRRGDEIVHYLPEEKVLWIEPRVTREGFPAVLANEPAELANFYQVRLGESGRIAGFDCQIILLEPKDHLRYGYRFCADKTSGLLLQAQTVDNRRIIEQIAFTQLSFGKASPHSAKLSAADTRDWRTERAFVQHVTVPGLSVGFLPSGFKQIAAVKRFLPPAAADNSSNAQLQIAAQGRPHEVVQIIFSDGLAAISVFIEPGSKSRTEGSVQQGATHIVGKRLGEFWLTIVGEVPAVAVSRVANSVEFKSNK